MSIETQDTLRALARIEGVPIGDHIAQLLEHWVKLCCEELKVAERVEELVAEATEKRSCRLAAPAAGTTFFLGRDLLDRFEALVCSRSKRRPLTPQGQLFEAVLDAGLAHLPAEGVDGLPTPERSEGWTKRQAKTFWVSREALDRLTQAHHRSGIPVPVKKTVFLEAVVAAGLDDLEAAECLLPPPPPPRPYRGRKARRAPRVRVEA